MDKSKIVRSITTGILASLAGMLTAAGAFVSFWFWIPAAFFAIPALRMSKQRI